MTGTALDFEQVRDAIGKAIGAFLDNDEKHSIHGTVDLFHLTSVDKIVTIAESNTLYASETTTLNDSSEVVYARNLALRILIGRPIGRYEAALIQVLQNPAVYPEWDIHVRTFVTSFCGSGEGRKAELPPRGVDTASAWLNYGRGGTGAALWYDPKLLVKHRPNAAVLVEVDYDEASQKARVEAFLGVALKVVQELGVDSSDTHLRLAAHITQAWLSRLAAAMKHLSFEQEDEWRYIYCEMVNRAEPWPRRRPRWRFKKHLRYSPTGRTIPFVEIPLPKACLKGILLGNSSPAREDHLLEALPPRLQNLLVWRSGVPVCSRS